MRVILGEAAHPHQPVQRAMGLIAVAGAELRQAQRQIAVAFEPVVVDLHMAGAIHGFQRIRALFIGMFLIDLGGEHVFALYLSQWPEASQSLRSTTCGVLISW